MKYNCYASCGFGIEGILAEELRRMNIKDVQARDARVYFSADEEDIARVNLFVRTADRIYIILDQFKAKTFDELFEQVREIPFSQLLPKDAHFPVNGNAVQSELMSVSDVQAVSKKAAVRSMAKSYGIKQFPETGNTFDIYVNILRDEVTVGLNTSGAGLNRRGYRLKNVQAPLKETLAAALLLISRWHSRDFYDPMCGSGTIPIEAAMMACNIAPGIYREFDAEYYNKNFSSAFKNMRILAKESITPPEAEVLGSDIDPSSVALAKEHAQNMKVADAIQFSTAAVADFKQPKHAASIVTNPPYAVRIGDRKEVNRLYKQLGRMFRPLNDTVVFILSSNPHFEKQYGERADRRRKLYNGNLQCTFYQYFRGRGR